MIQIWCLDDRKTHYELFCVDKSLLAAFILDKKEDHSLLRLVLYLHDCIHIPKHLLTFYKTTW